jgi:2-polyprenyl-6-methoxyphenol hydroxylase-like FAD-dependent oxidoreductase
MDKHLADVAIIGGGPVGMGLAIELGQRGVSCVVVERHEHPQPIPKGQNLTQRTMEHFHVWGVEEAVRAASPIPVDFGIGGLTAYGTLLSPYHYDWYQRVIVRPFYFRDNERLPQYETEAALRARAAQLPEVTTLYGWTAQNVAQDAAGVTVTIASADGALRDVRAQYAVGCDGARSLVREQAGLTQTSSDHESRMALLVFRSKRLNELLAHHKGKSFFNVLHPELDGYWRFFGRVDTGESWFFHAPVPVGTTRDNFDFHAYLEQVVGAPFDCDFQHIGFWDLRVAVADAYGAGRLFIAGDAAHSHPPYGGYGINTGLEDARNLGWKLAAALQGWAGPHLLDTYSEERQPVFVSTARDFIVNFIEVDRAFLRAHDPARDRADFEQAWAQRASGVGAEIHSFEPNYEGSPLVAGGAGGATGAVGAHTFKARAGHHLAPQILSSGRNVFEALGAGFTLLAFDADEHDVAALEAAARARGVPLTILRDTFAEGRCAYEARLILVRPDHFVAFATDAAIPNPDALLATVAGA